MNIGDLTRAPARTGVASRITAALRVMTEGLHTLLELLKENLIELGSAVKRASIRSFLEKAKVSGKNARLAKELLGLTEAPDAQKCQTGILRALEYRLDRAESWARRAKGLWTVRRTDAAHASR